MTTPIFQIRNLSVSYGEGSGRHRVLDNVSFAINQGEMVAIQGPSGSGKSTLFYILGCMLKPEEGEVWFRDQNINKLGDFELSLFRNRNIGFIFQQFHLLQRANVLDNILLPAKYPVEIPSDHARSVKRAEELAERMGLGAVLKNLPNQLSGGQQQRVAIARALMNDVDVILADEPTGNLDTVNANNVLEILEALHREGKTIVLITHDREVAERCPRKLLVRDGKIAEDIGGNPIPKTAPKSKIKTQKEKQDPWLGLMRILPLATQNIVRNRLRSILTMVGVSIGVGAVVAMLTLGNYTRERILEGYESLGVNRLGISGDRDWMQSANNISAVQFNAFSVSRDLIPLREIFPEVKLISPLLSSWSAQLTFGGTTYSDGVRALGVNHEYITIVNGKVAKGDPISAHHVDMRSGVCLVGDLVQKELGRGKTLIGEIITVGQGSDRIGYPCRVIGILEPQKSAIESFQPDKQVLLPFTYMQANQNIWDARIRNFTVTLFSGSDVEKVGTRIKGFFDLKYDGTGIFRVDSNSTLVAQMKRFLNIFAILLAGIAFLALLVGGIGIQNMMLVSIADRLKEIGLRKAIGATNRSVKQQILFEAMLLCGAAGLVGLIAGICSCLGLLFLATKLLTDLKFEVVIDFGAVAISCVAIIAVGILSGLAPAIKAERLQVIEALRAE